MTNASNRTDKNIMNLPICYPETGKPQLVDAILETPDGPVVIGTGFKTLQRGVGCRSSLERAGRPPTEEFRQEGGEVVSEPDPDAWSQSSLADEVAFIISPAGRLRREDREVAMALEITRLRAIIRDALDAFEGGHDFVVGELLRRSVESGRYQ